MVLALCLLCVPALLMWPTNAVARSKVIRVDVTKFGATANDGKSDTAAVLAAIDECRKHKSSVLIFPKGQYDFFGEDKASGQGPLFPAKDLQNTTIDGGGSTFMFHSYNVGAFHLSHCTNITLRNFAIDYARPPFSMGKIISAEGKSFDIEIDKLYPVEGNEGGGAFLIWDPEKKHPMAGGVEYYGAISTKLVSPGVLKLTLDREMKLTPGQLVLLRHRVYGATGIYASACENVRMENVTVHTVPGMALVCSNCTNVTVRRLRVVPRPGSGYPMTATADAMHLSGTRGIISIEDCDFEGMGDDAANIKTGLYSKVLEKLDELTVLSQHHLKIPDPPSPSDVMEITHHHNMFAYSTATVESAETLQDGVMKMKFKDPLPSEIAAGDLLGNATRVAKVRIKNCRVKNNRARGFLIQNRDVVVENCKFENCTMGGVWVLTEVYYFYESITSRNVVVKNCTFDNCGYWPGPAVLGVFVQFGPQSFTESPGAHRNVTFEGNFIRGADNSGILVNGVDGAVIRNNTIEQVCRDPYYTGGSAAISVVGSRNVTLQGNKCDPDKQGSGMKSVFDAGSGAEERTIKLVDNVGF